MEISHANSSFSTRACSAHIGLAGFRAIAYPAKPKPQHNPTCAVAKRSACAIGQRTFNGQLHDRDACRFVARLEAQRGECL